MARVQKLTPKQARFVEEYLVDLNATQAAIRAGYSEKTAAAVGYENLRKPHVAAAIEKAISERSERTRVTADMVVEELAKIGFSDMRRLTSWGPHGVSFIDSGSLEDEHAACVSEVSSHKTVSADKYGGTTEVVNSKLKLYDKLGALNSLGKHLGMFVERKEVTGKDGGPIQQEVRGSFDLAEDVRALDEEIERFETASGTSEEEVEEEGSV